MLCVFFNRTFESCFALKNRQGHVSVASRDTCHAQCHDLYHAQCHVMPNVITVSSRTWSVTSKETRPIHGQCNAGALFAIFSAFLFSGKLLIGFDTVCKIKVCL